MSRYTPLPLLPALLALSLPAGAADSGQLAPIVVTATRTAKTLDDTPIRTELVSRDEINRTHAACNCGRSMANPVMRSPSRASPVTRYWC